MRVAVIGGGIQGACVALELALRQIEVELFESKETVMDGASRHSEGKIHLGFVYANDHSLRTATLQARGASSFHPMMERWLGPAIIDFPFSSPFHYVVHRESLLDPDDLQSAYSLISEQVRSFCPDGSYFGIDEPWRLERVDHSDLGYGRAAVAAFSSREVAIDPDAIANLVTWRLTDTQGIEVHLSSQVTGVDPYRRLLEVSTAEGAKYEAGPYDHVVNCSWEGRPQIDSGVGLQPSAPWSFRMKYFLRTWDDVSLPTTTIVLGPFGDVVQYPNGDHYLSWYPVGRRGWSTDVSPPSWPTRLDPTEANSMILATLHHLAEVIPAVAEVSAEKLETRGGLIYALGDTDVDDPASLLHQRSKVGTTSVGGWYHSIDTGKYTTAPLFAVEAADRITAEST